MCHDVATNRLFGVDSVGHSTAWVGSDLIGDENCDVELLTDFLQPAEHTVEYLLPFRELTSTRVVDSEWGHDRVNDEERELVLDHCSCRLHEQGNQAVYCEGPPNHDVAQDLLCIQVEPVCNRLDSLRPERVLGVDEEDLALTSALRSGKLSSDAERVAQLGLSCPELSERLGDGHAFNTTLEKMVEGGTASRDPLDVLPPLEDLHATLEALAFNLLCYFVALFRLCLSDTLDVEHLLFGATHLK